MTLFELDDKVCVSMTDLEFEDWVVLSGKVFYRSRINWERACRNHERTIDLFSKMTGQNYKQLMAIKGEE